MPANCMIEGQPAYHPNYPPHPSHYAPPVAQQSPYGGAPGGPVNGMQLDGADEREAAEASVEKGEERVKGAAAEPRESREGSEGQRGGFTAVNG